MTLNGADLFIVLHPSALEEGEIELCGVSMYKDWPLASLAHLQQSLKTSIQRFESGETERMEYWGSHGEKLRVAEGVFVFDKTQQNYVQAFPYLKIVS